VGGNGFPAPPSPNDSKHQTAVRTGQKKRGRPSDSGLPPGLAASRTGGRRLVFLDKQARNTPVADQPLTRKKTTAGSGRTWPQKRSLFFTIPPPATMPSFYLTALMARQSHSTDGQGRISGCLPPTWNESRAGDSGQQPQTRRCLSESGLSDYVLYRTIRIADTASTLRTKRTRHEIER